MKAYPKPEDSERDWRRVAARVNKGEFRGWTDSGIEALVIGLRGYLFPECVKAIKTIDSKGKFRPKLEEKSI